MNKLILTGRLTADAELTFAKSGTDIEKFNIANNTGWGDNKKVMYIEVTLFKKEKLMPYLKKGAEFLLEGELHLDQWEKDGKKCQKHKMLANSIEFMSKTSNEVSNGQETGKESFEDEIPF